MISGGELATPAELLRRAGVVPAGEDDTAFSDPERVAALLAAAVRLYADLVEEGGIDATALESAHDLQATEVLRAVTALMKAADLETFELTMWKAWGRT